MLFTSTDKPKKLYLAIMLAYTRLAVGDADSTGTQFWIGDNLFMEGNITQLQTTVDAYHLHVNGTLYGDVAVHPGGVLGGGGRIVGNVVSNGEVAPDFLAVFSVDGNYTQNGTLSIEMNPLNVLSDAGVSERVSVTGTASLSGTVRPLPSESGYYPRGYQYLILHADQGVTGNLAITEQSRYAKFHVRYDTNDVYLVVDRQWYFESVGDTPNHRVFGAVIDATNWARSSPEMKSLFDYLTQGDRFVINTFMEENNPAVFDAYTAAGFENGRAYIGAISRVLRASGSQSAFISMPSTSLQHDRIATPSTGEPLMLSNVPSSAPADKDLNLWTSGIGSWSGQDTNEAARGYRLFSSGAAAGADYRLSSAGSVGVSFGYLHSDLDWQEDSGGGTGDTILSSVYGTYHANGFWGDGLIGMGCGWYDATRNIPSFHRQAQSDWTGQDYFASIEGGYDYSRGNWTIGPVAGLQYQHVHQSSFTEEDAGALNLHLDGRDADSLQSGLGLRAAYQLEAGPMLLLPRVRALWVHEYLDQARDIDASFADSPSATGTFHGPNPTRDSISLGLGLDAPLTSDLLLYLDYQLGLPLDGDAIATNSLYGGLRWKF